VGVTYNLWIPGGAPRLRCVIVQCMNSRWNGSHGGELS
jgi:hypothetical protein